MTQSAARRELISPKPERLLVVSFAVAVRCPL
jgi:hypothetical protein